MRQRISTFVALSTVVLLLSACGSVGDILGGGAGTGTDPNNGTYSSGNLRGIVESVDSRSRTIYLTNVTGYDNRLANGNGSGSSVRVTYDDRTSVDHEGRGYRPTDLERGDEVTVRVSENGSQLLADLITVVRDATPGNMSGGNDTPSGAYGSTVRGTVRYVDTSRRTIEVDRGSGSPAIIEYETRTPVSYSGRSYNVADLERGDEVEVRVSEVGNGRWLAQDIRVVRSMSSGGSNNNGGYGTANTGIVRGTVRYVDASRRTIELESTSGAAGFNTGGGVLLVQYENNATVSANGQNHPVGNLERGDVIEVEVDRRGSTVYASRIYLVRDVNAR